jgi:hypothetical protein
MSASASSTNADVEDQIRAELNRYRRARLAEEFATKLLRAAVRREKRQSSVKPRELELTPTTKPGKWKPLSELRNLTVNVGNKTSIGRAGKNRPSTE